MLLPTRKARFPEGTRARCSGHLLPRMRRPSFSLWGDRTDLLRKTKGAIDGHGPIAGVNTSFQSGLRIWVGRKCATQPQPTAAAEMASTEDRKRGRDGSASDYTGSNLIAEATRAREPRRVWVGSSLFGMSAFRNLRSGAAGIHSYRLSDWNSILTCRLRASSSLYAIAPTRIVAAGPAVTAARSDGHAVAEMCCSRIQWTAEALPGAVWTGAFHPCREDTIPCSGA